MVGAIIGLIEVVGKAALKIGAKAAVAGTKKIAMKTAPNGVKLAVQKKAEAKAITAAKYKASLLTSHGIPAKSVVVKTATGKAAYVVTATKPVIIKNSAGKVALTLVKTAEGGLKVVAKPVLASGAGKTAVAVIGKGIAIGGAVIFGLIGGGTL
jgi:hypothetical protein